jgi:hypothetical protein
MQMTFVYVENLKEFTKKPLRTNKQSYNICVKHFFKIVFLCTCTDHMDSEIQNAIPFIITLPHTKVDSLREMQTKQWWDTIMDLLEW